MLLSPLLALKVLIALNMFARADKSSRMLFVISNSVKRIDLNPIRRSRFSEMRFRQKWFIRILWSPLISWSIINLVITEAIWSTSC